MPAPSIMKRYEKTSYVPWLRDSKFLHKLKKDSVDSVIIDEELRSIQLDVETTTYVVVYILRVSLYHCRLDKFWTCWFWRGRLLCTCGQFIIIVIYHGRRNRESRVSDCSSNVWGARVVLPHILSMWRRGRSFFQYAPDAGFCIRKF